MLSRTNPRHGHGNSAPCKNNVSPYRWMRLLHTKTRCVSYFLDLSIFPASVRAGIPRAAQARSGETIGRLEILGSRTIGSLAVPPPPTPPPAEFYNPRQASKSSTTQKCHNTHNTRINVVILCNTKWGGGGEAAADKFLAFFFLFFSKLQHLLTRIRERS